MVLSTTPSITPTRTACFQPDNYHDPALFVDRKELLAELFACLVSYIEPDAPGVGRVLVQGERGTGKSMVTRQAIAQVRAIHGPLTVHVDGARTGHGSKAFWRQLAKELGKEALDQTTSEALKRSGEFLLRLAPATTITVKQVREWSRTLKLALNAGHQFWSAIGFEFGLERKIGGTRKLIETHERTVDADLLRVLIQSLVMDCHREKPVLLFLDNLDQVGYAENPEDVRQVMDLARYVLGFDHCVVVAALPSDLISADLRELHSLSIVVQGLAPDELMAIFDRRVKLRGQGARTKLERSGLVAIARRLARWTDNARSFLRWLAFLDYQRIDFTADEDDKLRAMLERFATQTHAGVRLAEMQRLAEIYATHHARVFLTKAELSGAGISIELIERARRYGVLEPDWLLSPARYLLSPTLHFLTARD